MNQFWTDFFMDESEMTGELNLFGWEHLLLLFCTAAAAALLFCYRDRLRGWRHREIPRFVLAALLFLNMAVFYGVFVVKGTYDWHIHLPLHFCFISGFLFLAVLVSGSRRWFGVVYFFTWAGPLPAMIWPNTPTRFDRYLTYPFFISHHLLLLAGLYCLVVLQYRVEKRDIRRAFVWGNAIFGAVFLFNQVFGTNYIMTDQLPDHILQMFPFLQYVNIPILWLELCALAAIAVAYQPVRLLRWLDRDKREFHQNRTTLGEVI